ncbi:homeobox-leucine zipper protein ROC1-like [Salvia splendens]|uniref:homeobox-leucine zipper protein ROC1-like n=1 Tax=Salvia splendens TaxID=180675 RepID=UPI001C2587FE|nr:homeobox-leucine zipper protein ROC1-like [Salvia splendens]XP_042019234.1 homeobox-leucine zipper protein ROC1-like [Salvia splendens]
MDINILKYSLQGHKSSRFNHRGHGECKWICSSDVCRVSHLLSSYLADVSLETFHPNPFPTSKRKPSGCLIQALGDGVSKVTWVEHSSESGVAYSAKRWISTLERQCERIATLEARDDSLNDKGSGAATNGLLRLAGRMNPSSSSRVDRNISLATCETRSSVQPPKE